MRQESKQAYAQMRAAHWATHDKLVRLRNALLSSGDLRELTDTVYALKECSKLAEDLRKELDKQAAEFIKRACALWVAEGTGEPVRTDYTTGSPRLKQTAVTPKEGTPEYSLLLQHFGIPENTPFRPHWPAMRDRIAKDLAEGKPLPAGVDPSTTQTLFEMTCLKRRPVIDEGDAPELTDPSLLVKQYRLLQKITQAAIEYTGLTVDQADLDAPEEEAPVQEEESLF